MVVGFLCALLGALGSGIGSILESLGVQHAGVFGAKTGKLGRAGRQPHYWSGIGVDIIGFVCGAVALHLLPLFLVQSVLALSIGVTAAVSVLLGAHLPRGAWLALAFAAGGLVLLAISAEPGPANILPVGWRWGLAAMVVPVSLIAWFGNRLAGRTAASVLAFGAGLAFTCVAISVRSFNISGPWYHFLAEPAVWAIIVNGATGAVVFAMALQKGSATTASSVMCITNTVLPSAVGLLALGDVMRPGFVVAGAFGFLFAVSGAVSVAHYSACVDSHRLPKVTRRRVTARPAATAGTAAVAAGPGAVAATAAAAAKAKAKAKAKAALEAA